MLTGIIITVVIVLAVAFIAFIALFIWGSALNAKDPSNSSARYADAGEPALRQPAVDHATFPGLETKRARVVGMMHYMEAEWRETMDYAYVDAFPEPGNEHDPNAVQILSPTGIKIGYLSAGQAKLYSPLIQQIGSLRINAYRDGIKLWMDLPTVPELRKAISKRS